MPEKILRLNEVLSRTGLSRTMLYDKISKGEFPAPIHLGKRAVGWFEPRVDEWIIEQVEKQKEAFYVRKASK